MRQCAEDACIALGFINPGDVATMMARMKKALKGLARCWTLYNLSWAVLALKAAFSMTRTTNVHGAVVWEYPRFERQACASAAMYARCDAKVALHPSPSPTSPRPASTADSPDVFTTQALRAAGVADRRAGVLDGVARAARLARAAAGRVA